MSTKLKSYNVKRIAFISENLTFFFLGEEEPTKRTTKTAYHTEAKTTTAFVITAILAGIIIVILIYLWRRRRSKFDEFGSLLVHTLWCMHDQLSKHLQIFF